MTTATESLTIARDAIVELIQSLRDIPNGDASLPEVIEFTVGRKQVAFTGPLRKAQALVALSSELRTLQSDLSRAIQVANSGGSFVHLGVK